MTESDFAGELRRLPLARMLLPFIAGITLCKASDHFSAFLYLLIPVLCFAALLLARFTLFVSGSRQQGILMQVFLLSFGWGWTGLLLHQQEEIPAKALDAQFIGEMREYTVSPGGGYRAILQLKACKEDSVWKPMGQLVLADFRAPLKTEPRSGNCFLLAGRLYPASLTGNPGEFNYREYLLNRGITARLRVDSGQVERLRWKDAEFTFDLKVHSENLRAYLLAQFRKQGIDGEEYAVLSALTLGYRSSISDELMQAYSGSGAMHVLSVSGLHVGIVYLVLEYFLSFFRRSKYYRLTRLIIGFIFLWFYAFITGCSPPVMRASAMFSFMLAGSSLKRPVNSLNTLASSAFCILLINPNFLNDIGFQLSYVAVLSILLMHQPIYSLLQFKRSLADKLWSLTALSLAAQTGTFPLGLFYFHQFPGWFLLTNLVVVPLSGLILYAAMAFLCLSWIPIVPGFLALALEKMVRLLNHSVLTIGQFPGPELTRIPLNNAGLLLLYVFLTAGLISFLYRSYRWFLGTVVLLLFFLAYTLYVSSSAGFQQKLVVYQVAGHTVIDLVDGSTGICLHDSALMAQPWLMKMKAEPYRISARYEVKNFLAAGREYPWELRSRNYFVRCFSKGSVFIKNGNRRILFLSDETGAVPDKARLPYAVDYLIIGGKGHQKLEAWLKIASPKMLVLDSSVPAWRERILEQLAQQAGISFWSVRLNGALVRDL